MKREPIFGPNASQIPEKAMNREPILGPYWKWQVLCVVLFSAGMGFLHWLIRGINQDFGMGVVVGLPLGLFIAYVAVGWRERPRR